MEVNRVKIIKKNRGFFLIKFHKEKIIIMIYLDGETILCF